MTNNSDRPKLPSAWKEIFDDDGAPLTADERVQRTVILCGHCLRNIAYYRAGWRQQVKIRVSRQFWIRANGNFMDMAILDWCKLFADKKGQHHWTKSIADHDGFSAGLRARLGYTEAKFDEYVESVKHLRDKFIAHLDNENVMLLPLMRPARISAAYLHDELLTRPETRQWFRDDEIHLAGKIYPMSYKEAFAEYLLAGEPFRCAPVVMAASGTRAQCGFVLFQFQCERPPNSAGQESNRVSVSFPCERKAESHSADNHLILLVGRLGLEPRTKALKGLLTKSKALILMPFTRQKQPGNGVFLATASTEVATAISRPHTLTAWTRKRQKHLTARPVGYDSASQLQGRENHTQHNLGSSRNSSMRRPVWLRWHRLNSHGRTACSHAAASERADRTAKPNGQSAGHWRSSGIGDGSGSIFTGRAGSDHRRTDQQI